MMDILENITCLQEEALTEFRWYDYIQQYVMDNNLVGIYQVTETDLCYGESMINSAYSHSWRKIKLSRVQIPEAFKSINNEID